MENGATPHRTPTPPPPPQQPDILPANQRLRREFEREILRTAFLPILDYCNEFDADLRAFVGAARHFKYLKQYYLGILDPESPHCVRILHNLRCEEYECLHRHWLFICHKYFNEGRSVPPHLILPRIEPYRQSQRM